MKQTFKYLPILILFDITFYAISLFEKSKIFIYFKKKPDLNVHMYSSK